MWEANRLQSRFSEKNTEVLVDNKLNVSQQRAFATKNAHKLLGCIRNSTASRPRQVIPPLYSALVRQLWASQSKRDTDILDQVQLAMNTIKGLGHLIYRERLRKVVLFSWEKRWLGPKSVKMLDRRVQRRQSQTLLGCIQ